MAGLEAVDDHRKALGFLTVADVIRLGDRGVRVLDPFSTLISAAVEIGEETVIYPGAVLQCDQASTLTLGSGNLIYPGSVLLAASGGRLAVGRRCELGPGIVQIKANHPDSVIEIGDGARLLNGCEVVGRSQIGAGCQIIGAVAAQSVVLEGGSGGHEWPDPDERGAVIKGMGLARGLVLKRGEVVNLQPNFASVPVERQRAYHPGPAGTGADPHVSGSR